MGKRASGLGFWFSGGETAKYAKNAKGDFDRKWTRMGMSGTGGSKVGRAVLCPPPPANQKSRIDLGDAC